MTIKRYIIGLSKAVAFCSFVMTGMTSCDYKDLIDGTELKNVTVQFAWEDVDSIPDAMRVAFYPADPATMESMPMGYTYYDMPKTIWPATVQLPIGIYHVTAWNNDTEHVLTEKYESQSTLNSTSPEYNPRGSFDTPALLDSIYNGQKVLDYPDYMVHANTVDYEVLKGSEMKKLTLQPDSMVVAVDYKIHGIGGLSWVKQIRGAINNVAGRRYIAYDNRTEEPVAVMFDCQYNEEDSLVYGSFYIFGIEPTETKNLTHKMVLFFWMNEGKVYLPIDVTKAVKTYRQENKKILIDIPSLGIDLRDFISSKNTFEVDLEEWSDVNIDVGF